MGDGSEGFNGLVETEGCGLDFLEGALRFGEGIDELGELDLDKGNVEFEVNLFGGNVEGTGGVVEGGFHG